MSESGGKEVAVVPAVPWGRRWEMEFPGSLPHPWPWWERVKCADRGRLVSTRLLGTDWWWYAPVTVTQACFHVINWLAGGLEDFLDCAGLDVKTYEIQDYWWLAVEELWPKGVIRPFLRNPWAEQMVYEAFRNQYLALSGCASSGKSEFGAIWAITEWMRAPVDTLCLVTSTSLEAARKRIWGSIKDFYVGMRVPKGALKPGKLVDSVAKIRAKLLTEEGWSDKAGIQLVACEQGKDTEAIGKLIGIKAKRVVMVADELPEISESIVNAALGNLNKNPYFQFIGIGNHKSLEDAFGKFSAPEGGWRSVDVDTTQWKTRLGKCIRFDGTKSPNLRYKEDQWPIYGRKNLEDDTRILGPSSVLFWRMCRSFPAPAGTTDTVYSDAELVEYGAFDKVRWGTGEVANLLSLDPAFTSGGDRSPIMWGQLGVVEDGRRVLMVKEVWLAREDVEVKQAYDRQVLEQFRKKAVELGIHPRNCVFDATGAGISFGTLMTEVWSDEPLAVKFGGAASDRYVASGDMMKPACDVYGNRVTELWYQGKEYLRGRQLCGLTLDIAEDLVGRQFTVQKGSEARVSVEPKKDMKKRGLRSPDLGDAVMLLVELARARFGWEPNTVVTVARNPFRADREESLAQVYDLVYDVEAVLVGE